VLNAILKHSLALCNVINTLKDENAALVIESKTGLVILRLSKDKTYYDIISAYDRKSHPGTVIARI
jgi:hypothetical protein